MKLISIVIPAFNEEENIPELAKQVGQIITKISRYDFEVIVVENGSFDNTLGALLDVRKKDQRFKIVQLAKNEGCDGGIVAGLSYARGEAVIIMMADLQDSPRLLPDMIKLWEQGNEIVYTVVKKRVGVPFTRRFGTFVFYRMMNYLTRDLLPESSSDFRLLDKRVYRQINAMPEHNKYFRGLSMWMGFQKTSIAFERPARFAGHSKAHFLLVFKVALNALFSFTMMPARIPWLLTFLTFTVSLLFLFTKQYSFFLMSTLLFGFSLNLGIQGEYFLRILAETQGRPNFIVRSVYGFAKDNER